MKQLKGDATSARYHFPRLAPGRFIFLFSDKDFLPICPEKYPIGSKIRRERKSAPD
jgi:hypothetical protein